MSETKFFFRNLNFGTWQETKCYGLLQEGALKKTETPAEALKRELYEELGIVVDLLGEPIFQLDVWIEGKQGSFISREIYYQITIQSDTVLSIEHMTKNEKDTLKGLKWWSKDELQKINDFAPREILNYI